MHFFKKIKFYLFFVLAFSLFGSYSAFALFGNPGVGGDCLYSVTADKSSYAVGDLITVSGYLQSDGSTKCTLSFGGLVTWGYLTFNNVGMPGLASAAQSAPFDIYAEWTIGCLGTCYNTASDAVSYTIGAAPPTANIYFSYLDSLRYTLINKIMFIEPVYAGSQENSN